MDKELFSNVPNLNSLLNTYTINELTFDEYIYEKNVLNVWIKIGIFKKCWNQIITDKEWLIVWNA